MFIVDVKLTCAFVSFAVQEALLQIFQSCKQLEHVRLWGSLGGHVCDFGVCCLFEPLLLSLLDATTISLIDHS